MEDRQEEGWYGEMHRGGRLKSAGMKEVWRRRDVERLNFKFDLNLGVIADLLIPNVHTLEGEHEIVNCRLEQQTSVPRHLTADCN